MMETFYILTIIFVYAIAYFVGARVERRLWINNIEGRVGHYNRPTKG